ncbi:MAG: hypothetical protein GXC72_11745 [Chitinophagaceae bacterium]|nr:hypothetical protein [Chitinophagaceae bacterium]
MKKWFKHNRLPIAGALTGALAGYVYWKFIGCTTGSCAITSRPLNSTLYFAVLGMLLFSLFQKNKKTDSHAQ